MKPNFKLSNNLGANEIITAMLFWSLLWLLQMLFSSVAAIFGTQYSRLLYGVLGACSALFVTSLFLRYEKRSFKEIGLAWQSDSTNRFVTGLLIGSTIFSVILLALLVLTPLQLQRNTKAIDYTAILGYLAFLPLSLLEEITFWAYPFIKLHQRFGLRMTQVIVAFAFVLWHVVGRQSVFSSFLGPGVYAFVFGLAVVWSGGIAVPLGIHVALNILQPLTGMRGDAGAAWTLSQSSNVANDSMAAPETIGLVMQLVVLVAALLLTEYYIRTKGNQRTQNEWGNYSNAESPEPLATDFLQKPQPTAHNNSFQE